jgi:hypothetical protein
VRISGWIIIGLAVITGTLYVWNQFSRPALIAARQEKSCNKQANRVFTTARSPLDGSVGRYRYHFNERLGRCLMLVAYTVHDPRDHETRKHFTVGDAFQQVATYAEYFETALPGFRTAVLQCSLTVPKEKPVLCHSAQEWNRLVKPYMDTGALTQ